LIINDFNFIKLLGLMNEAIVSGDLFF